MADNTKSKLNKVLSLIVGILAALLFVSAIVLLVIHYWPVKNNYSGYMNNVSAIEEQLPENPVNFAKFKKQNQDICGFIDIDSLDIHEPIVCAGPEKEENYYLRRDLEGKYSTGGTVYIQKMNSVNFSDPCTVIYGHNMGNLTMFGRLKEFREKEFFDNNEYFRICCPGHVKKYSIKAAFVYDDRH
ncbi:MAG: class B sortase, partial [Clostridia bacterium]|nr:class B sortase [Clostridia bacterium]